jgi:hypothetical protein
MKPNRHVISALSLLWLAGCGGAYADSAHTTSRPDVAGKDAPMRSAELPDEPDVEPSPYAQVTDPPARSRPAWVDERSSQQSPYRVEVVSGDYRPLPTFYQSGRAYVLGSIGERYRIKIANPTGRRVEAVVSVDGLDAIDGRTASYDKRGYLIPAWGEISVDGFRTSAFDVATFRFSSVRDSYAGRKGQDRNVGVIGVAFFPERYVPPPAPRPRPMQSWRYRPYGGAESDAKDEASPPSAAPRARSAEAAPRGAAPAPEATAEARRKADDRPGLGTEFGEQRESHVEYTEFQRANASSPSSVYAVRYDDRRGLTALGIAVDPPRPTYRETRLRETADPFPESRFAEPPPPRY